MDNLNIDEQRISVKKIDDCFIKLLTPNSVQSSIFFMQANPASMNYEIYTSCSGGGSLARIKLHFLKSTEF